MLDKCDCFYHKHYHFLNAEDKLDQKPQVAELQLPSSPVLSKGLLHSTTICSVTLDNRRLIPSPLHIYLMPAVCLARCWSKKHNREQGSSLTSNVAELMGT